MKPPKDLHGLYLQKLQKSDPIAYNTAMCKIIQAKTKEIILPNLTKEEMQHLKKHLEDYEKIKGKDIETKFLNLRNAFLIVNEMEKNTEARKNGKESKKRRSQHRTTRRRGKKKQQQQTAGDTISLI